MRHFSAQQLQQHLEQAAQAPLLLDVREPWEYDLCHLEGSALIPMGQIPAQLDTLDKDKETIVICHHGVRSLQVAYFLEHNGFTNIINLSGGVDAWAHNVDPTMATY